MCVCERERERERKKKTQIGSHRLTLKVLVLLRKIRLLYTISIQYQSYNPKTRAGREVVSGPDWSVDR